MLNDRLHWRLARRTPRHRGLAAVRKLALTALLGWAALAAASMRAGETTASRGTAAADKPPAAEPPRARGEAQAVVESVEKLHAQFNSRLEQLARWCDEHALAGPAETTRRWIVACRADQSCVGLLDASTRFPVLSEGASAEQRQWRERLVKLRQEQAAACFTLAQRAADAGQLTLAFELVMAGARQDPDNEKVRELLGYRRLDDRWLLRGEAERHRKGYVRHETFGWLPQARVARYEKGERYYQGRWISAAEEAEHRSANIDRGWRVETEHFTITTNHSLEKGVELARKLERFYGVWLQVFVRYWASASQIEQFVRGRAPLPLPTRKHNVVYFRTRDEYNAFLKQAQPNIAITLGIYFDNVRTSYFFDGDDQDDGTLYHEATHQLFQEARPVSRAPAARANFWAVEAIACYMESLVDNHHYLTLGGLDAGRVPAARVRLLQDGFYVPLAELVALGRQDLQGDRRIAKLYSQSAGLAAFLMHGQQRRYRDAFVDYLRQVYANRDDHRSLAEAAGVDYPSLDEQYRRFLARGN